MACSSVILLFACTRENPAFDTGAGETLADESGDEVGETLAETGTDQVCELAAGKQLTLQFPPNCGENTQDELSRADWILEPTITGSQITGTWCTAPGCTACEFDVPYVLEIQPIGLENLSFEGDCLRVMGRREADSDSCNYHTLAIWNEGDVEPVFVGSRSPDASLPPIDTALGNFSPGLDLTAECPCETHSSSCCDGSSNPPQLFRFELPSGDYVNLGSTWPVTADGLEYTFLALDAFDPGGCDSTGANMTWALTR